MLCPESRLLNSQVRRTQANLRNEIILIVIDMRPTTITKNTGQPHDFIFNLPFLQIPGVPLLVSQVLPVLSPELQSSSVLQPAMEIDRREHGCLLFEDN